MKGGQPHTIASVQFLILDGFPLPPYGGQGAIGMKLRRFGGRDDVLAGFGTTLTGAFPLGVDGEGDLTPLLVERLGVEVGNVIREGQHSPTHKVDHSDGGGLEFLLLGFDRRTRCCAHSGVL